VDYLLTLDFQTLVSHPLIIAGIGAFLALLISSVDAVVNNYGEVEIVINEKKNYTVTGGSPLLLTLAEQQIFIPSACGGRGTCGACKCKVESDIGPHYPTEVPFMEKAEIKENIRLSCQIKVKTDLSITIPEYLFNVKEYHTTVESIVPVTHDIRQIRFRLKEEDEMSYVAGQYMQFEAPPYDKIKSPTQRAYSMSSQPSDKGIVEMLIRLVPGGIVTTYVFEHLKEGDPVKLIGPFGDFYVRETDADMICVAGGSGMAPIKSIVYDLQTKGETNRNIWYFFGARSLRDLFYLEEMKELEKQMPNFHFVAALSEPMPDDNWTGETGLITDVLDKYLKETIGDHTKEGYLCGSPGMIDACVNVMSKNNMPDEKIYYDKFA
jgi:Na+-transporting NADH:ubiquinone oxidoreductase subunit F